MKKIELSVVLAVRNEEENIGRCIKSVRGIADEIIVFDEYSTDKTKEIAEGLGAVVYQVPHSEIFHITKQKALEKARGEWVLQLDADEEVTKELAGEIREVIEGTHRIKLNKLFIRHQKLIEKRDGKIGEEEGEIAGYFIPRINYFLGKPLIHAGVYPDGVIRLVRNGFAEFPQKSVHEQISLKGKVSWLENPLNHYDSPTLKRYFARFNRYTDLHAEELREKKVSKGLIGFLGYVIYKPVFTFFNLYLRHLGFLDGVQGFLWSVFSALHFPIAYFKYFTS